MLAIKSANMKPYKTLLFPVSMSHALLFIKYIILATMFKIEESWPFKIYATVCVASLLPFGTFYVEKKVL
jgi:integral membrane protein